jgi:hypothetical protein
LSLFCFRADGISGFQRELEVKKAFGVHRMLGLEVLRAEDGQGHPAVAAEVGGVGTKFADEHLACHLSIR